MLKALLKFYTKYKDGIQTAAYLISLIIWNFISNHVKYGEFIGIPFILLYLYAYYRNRQNRKKELLKQGLTFADVNNMAFVDNWAVIRKKDAVKYYLSNGGFITGAMVFIPLSFITFYSLGIDTLMASVGNLLMMTVGLFSVSFLIGCIICYFRWQINERRFAKLTSLTA